MKKATKKTTENPLNNKFEIKFDRSMHVIAKSFEKIDERFDKIEQRLVRHDKALELIFKQTQTFTEEAREHRQTMASLVHTDIKQERGIEDLRIRVERLEAKS